MRAYLTILIALCVVLQAQAGLIINPNVTDPGRFQEAYDRAPNRVNKPLHKLRMEELFK